MALSLGKLRGRSASEFLDRARQGAARWLERRGLGDIGEPRPARLFVQDAASSPAIRGAFFSSFDDRDATLRALRSVDPAFESSLRARADRLLGGQYDLLGHRDLAFGNPIDWWLEPLAGLRAPNQHWSRIDFLDPTRVGDHKLLWELGRHNALVTLGQAWWCTRDSRYADHCLALLTSWLDANPPKQGVHWTSSLELSFRCIAWLWVLALVDDVISPDLRRRVIGHLAVAGRHIERHLSTWFSPNTHLTGEALGLFAIGTALPQCREAMSWQRTGAGILLNWVDRHVRADGSYVEQSTWYHRYTTDFYLHFLVLAERAGIPVRSRIEPALGGLLEHLMWITRPDGTMPLIGDDDGGRLLFLDERTAHDTRTPLAEGAALLGRADLAAVAGTPSTELIWLLGPSGLRAFQGLTPRFPAATARAFVEGGTYVLRSDWGATASVMTIDAGPHGFLNGGHAHADALSVDLTVRGRQVLVDPGTFTYTTSPTWRDSFRETAAHSAVTVDGCGSASVAGPFQWASRAESRCEVWDAGGDVVLFSGSHDGFERLRPRIRYRRYIAWFAPDVWVVRDEIRGEGEHELTVHWQGAPGLACRGGAGSLTLFQGRSDLLDLHVVEAAIWRFADGWVSPAYGTREIAPHVTCSVRGIGRAALTTVLCEPGLSLRANADTSQGAPGIRMRWKDRDGVLFFADDQTIAGEWKATLRWIDMYASHRPIE
ncbi:MAG TPA: alginate lyase family protein [Gemmatimonadaceae bacterium]